MEKKGYEKIKKLIKDKDLSTIICVPESYDDENNTIYFEPGLCNLKEFTEIRAENKIYWYNKIEEFRGIIITLIEFVLKLVEYEIYNTDLKP